MGRIGDTEQNIPRTTRIIKAELLPAMPYYDFHVPVYENYVVLGMVHHNTGKSVCGRAIAKELDMPLLILDYSSLKSSLVGESENRLKDTLEQVRALRGCVLLIDEFDKAAQGQTGDNTGVSQAMMGILLSWMADRPEDDRTFIVLTMNRTQGLSPEMFRAGRLDRMFHTDLPAPDDRWQIFQIHCRRRAVNADGYTAKERTRFLTATDGFTGAEIEQALKDARFVAFGKRQTGAPSMDELVEECKRIPTVSRLDGDNIRAITEFCIKAGTYPVDRERGTLAEAGVRGLDLFSEN